MIDLVKTDEYIISLLQLLEKHPTNSGKIKILIELKRLDYNIDNLNFDSIQIISKKNFMSILNGMITRDHFREESIDDAAELIADYTVHELEYIRDWAKQ